MDADEATCTKAAKSTKLKKAGVKMSCKRSGHKDHNMRTCKNIGCAPKALPKKKKAIDGLAQEVIGATQEAVDVNVQSSPSRQPLENMIT
ncbi:hypothetical protein SLE2022_275770 [Rubroshorea leprosula]